MAVKISKKISDKLHFKHGVCETEVAECFANIEGRYLLDTREEHKSDPPTLWFIAETNMGRKLKVVFVSKEGDNYIKSAFEPNSEEIRIYHKSGI